MQMMGHGKVILPYSAAVEGTPSRPKNLEHKCVFLRLSGNETRTSTETLGKTRKVFFIHHPRLPMDDLSCGKSLSFQPSGMLGLSLKVLPMVFGTLQWLQTTREAKGVESKSNCDPWGVGKALRLRPLLLHRFEQAIQWSEPIPDSDFSARLLFGESMTPVPPRNSVGVHSYHINFATIGFVHPNSQLRRRHISNPPRFCF